MRFFQRKSGFAIFVVALGGAWLAVACSGDDSADSLSSRRSTASSSSGGAGDDDGGAQNGSEPAEELAFDKVKGDLRESAGMAVMTRRPSRRRHRRSSHRPIPYKSINAIITKDPDQSSLIQKGAHAGPGLDTIPGFEDELKTWLEAEAVAIQAQALPTTPAFTVIAGDNDVDLTPAALSGLSNVHLKFTAALVGTILSLTKVRISAPVGQDVHVVHPLFVRVLAKANADGDTDIEDPVDSFSNLDDEFPQGAETSLSPGEVLFTSPTWNPFDIANDKLRVELTKLEEEVAIIEDNTCADPTKFAADVLPTLRNTQTSAGNNCQGCHNNGLAGLSLSGNDPAAICNQVIAKLTKGDIGSSLIVKKVSNTPGLSHGGGSVTDTAAWKALFVNNAADFFKP